jgi:hypothetical protein
MTEILLVVGVLIGLAVSQFPTRFRRGYGRPIVLADVLEDIDKRPLTLNETYNTTDDAYDALNRLMKHRQVEKCENLRQLVIRLFEARTMLGKVINNVHRAAHPELYQNDNTNNA